MSYMRGDDNEPAAIEARGLVKQFRRAGLPPLRAVDGLDLTVPPGQIVAFLGPNGAGKTTTLDLVLGLTTPDAGTVRVAGRTPRAAVRAGKVSAVLQSGGLLADLTVAETVRLIASTFDRARPTAEVMERAGITELAGRRVSKCSGGEQQRLRFALALLPNPELLILDEPTAGMDVSARHEFWATMRADVAAGRTVVFATHYLEEADTFAERIVLVSAGRVVADGSTTEIRTRGVGRTISVTIPDRDAAAWLARVRTIDGVRTCESRGERAFLTAADTDAVALVLLRDFGAHGIEIAPPTLDSAFLALTGAAAPRATSYPDGADSSETDGAAADLTSKAASA